MGNLMYAIPDEKHAFCRNRETKRLYIRQGPKEKKVCVMGLNVFGMRGYSSRAISTRKTH